MYPQRVSRLPGLAMLGLQQVGIYPSAKDSDSDSESSYSYKDGSRYNSNSSSFGNVSNQEYPNRSGSGSQIRNGGYPVTRVSSGLTGPRPNANPRGNLYSSFMPLNSSVPFPMMMPPPRTQPDLDRNGNIIRNPRQAWRDSDMSDSESECDRKQRAKDEKRQAKEERERKKKERKEEQRVEKQRENDRKLRLKELEENRLRREMERKEDERKREQQHRANEARNQAAQRQQSQPSRYQSPSAYAETYTPQFQPTVRGSSSRTAAPFSSSNPKPQGTLSRLFSRSKPKSTMKGPADITLVPRSQPPSSSRIGSRQVQRTAQAALGDMTRTYVEGFEAPAGSVNIASMARGQEEKSAMGGRGIGNMDRTMLEGMVPEGYLSKKGGSSRGGR